MYITLYNVKNKIKLINFKKYNVMSIRLENYNVLNEARHKNVCYISGLT